MNLRTLFKRTLSLGFWGILTMFHMSWRVFLGLLLFVFPHQVVAQLLTPSTLETSSDLILYIARGFGLHLIAVGLLFGFFGSVTDVKARRRITFFVVLTSLFSILWNCLSIYTKAPFFTRESELLGILVNGMGLLLCVVSLVLSKDPLFEGKRKAT